MARLTLKRSSGFFAAGQEIERASALLSDGAFKLFVFVCMRAERNSGRLRFGCADLARQVGKSPRSITSYFQELQRHGVCELQAAVNQHETGLLEIADDFWPYHKQAAQTPSEQAQYIDQVRATFLSRSCVAGTFAGADERLAAELYRRHVSIEQFKRAYVLGCARKYVALLNHSGGSLISSLSYFTNLLAELSEQPVSQGYCQHIEQQLDRLEQRWLQEARFRRTVGHADIAQPTSTTNEQETR